MSVFLPMDGSPRFERGGFLRPRDGDLQRQDFLLFSHSRFFAADAREAATLFSIISTGSGVQQVSRILAFAVGGGRWRQVGIMVAALSRLTLNPLRPTFHSATPYMLGEGHVVKYSLELVNPSKPLPWRGGAIIKALAEAKRRVTRAVTTDDHLRTELRETLREPMQLRLYVHAVEIARWASSPGTLIDAVEDATTDWNDLGAEKVHVATVTFEPQDPTREDAMQGGEVWAFNPWNALKAHRPVGSINRGRLSIMRDSAKLRAQANGQRAPGPAANAGEPLSYTEQKAAE
jgi:hypothetical protein